MMLVFILLCLITNGLQLASTSTFLYDSFPVDFQWGVTEPIYRVLNTNNNATEKISADIQNLKELGVKTFKFSLDVASLTTSTDLASFNNDAVGLYTVLIDGLKNNDIEPHVTIFDSELPPTMQRDGWKADNVVQQACNFANNIFKIFGNKVTRWSTFTKPLENLNKMNIPESVENEMKSVHNMLLTHQCAYHNYKNGPYRGEIGIDVELSWLEPLNAMEPNISQTIDGVIAYQLGKFVDPILRSGDYPDLLKARFSGVLPAFTSAQIGLIKGSADFLGISYHVSYHVTRDDNDDNPLQALLTLDTTYNGSGNKTFLMNPDGLEKLLKKLVSLYPSTDLYVTDTGPDLQMSDVRDTYRVQWIKDHANAVLRAIQSDNVKQVKGFSVSRLVGNDMYASDGFYLNTKDRKRRLSALYYHQIITENGFIEGYNGPGGLPSGYIQHENGIYYDDFPDDFIWSSATSAYQIEGGWNEDGKGLSIWDVHANKPGNVFNNDNGKIACDSYHKYMEDVKILKNLGTKFYRFSIAWTRLMPDGTNKTMNEAGIAYYNSLINALLDQGIQPMVTLYHWDLPQSLNEYGGWLNETTTDLFQDYADLCYQSFGDRVKYWITFNEPWIVSYLGYGVAVFPPGLHENVYDVTHNLIKAHAKAYRVYKRKYSHQNAQVGITLNVGWSEPFDSNNPEDLVASDRDVNFNLGWFAHAIYVNGDYPEVMKKNVAEKSKIQGLAKSRLPEFTRDEKEYINGTGDFLGLNFYTSGMITSDIKTDIPGGYDDDKDIRGVGDPGWLGSGSSWLKVTPFGMRKILNWLKKEYNNIGVFVTENGVSDRNATLQDYHRIHYYRTYINEMLKAIKLDKCNVKGYTAWSLMDNFEWGVGYAEKFGLHYVNFSDPSRPRIPKASAYWYNQMVTENGYKPGYTAKGGRGTAPDYVGKFYLDTFPHNFMWGISDLQHIPLWYAEDYIEIVQRLRHLKVDHYKITLTMSALKPNKDQPLIPEGVTYYMKLLDELIKWNIQPVVVLYDGPTEGVQDSAQWLDVPMVERYTEYAEDCFKTFGSKVKTWMTFNDPMSVNDTSIEGSQANITEDYKRAKNILMAHGRSYRIYQTKYASLQKGKVGLNLEVDWNEPLDEISPDDWDVSDKQMMRKVGVFSQPLFGDGNFPSVDCGSLGLDCTTITMTEAEVKILKGSADFFGATIKTAYQCSGVTASCKQDSDWKSTGDGLKIVPWAVRKSLNWIKSHYSDVDILVSTPSYIGVSDAINDLARISFHRDYINELLKAVKLDKVKVIGYTSASLVGNMDSGTNNDFGFYQAKYNNMNLDITPKASAMFYRNIINTNGFAEEKFDVYSKPEDDEFLVDTFPSNFLWSAATAAYQVEGGANEDGRGPSIWDTYSHMQGNVDNNDNGDVSCYSYKYYKKDVKLLQGLGVSSYRFSISWSRIFPSGYGTPNQEGIDYYNRLIDALLEANIEPMVTLYHWDLPQALQDYDGWLNETTADLFADYADLCFREFGDKVKFWITLNEPWVVSLLGHEYGIMAPGKQSNGTFAYQVSRTLILAHAKAFRRYEQKYKSSQHGKVGITMNCDWWVPKNPNDPGDRNAAERGLQFHIGWFAHPIYKNGDYPDVMKQQINRRSNSSKSRLPPFSEDEKKMIKGTYDFLGLNMYTSVVVSHNMCEDNDTSYNCDQDLMEEKDPSWIGSGSSWLKVTPWGMRRLLNWLKTEYDNVPVYITENGISDRNGSLNDQHRIYYYNNYINNMLKAIKLDGCNVKGYTAWSLLDNFEWSRGYSEKFGLHYVNFSDPTRPRIPKASAAWYRQLVTRNGFVNTMSHVNEMYYGQFPEDFGWAVATAAYQIEGGVKEGGRGPSIWDEFSHTPNKILMNHNGDIADDSYHKYNEDVNLLRSLKVTHYRFSIAWPRIFPQGSGTKPNQAGIDYYNKVINLLLSAKIIPLVTLYHWDLPLELQKYGGWTNRTTADLFAYYADACFNNFGDRVKNWITINEPWVISYMGYGSGEYAPGWNKTGTADYQAAHTLILAHAKAYRIYESKYKDKQNGQVGITMNCDYAIPKNKNDPLDYVAAERHLQFMMGWFAHAIYIDGDYPPIMRRQIDRKSKHLKQSRLPTFTAEEKNMIKGTGDFIGLNQYTTVLADDYEYPDNYTNYNYDKDVKLSHDPSWLGSGSDWLFVTPFGMRGMLNWIKKTYGDVPIYITENGVTDRNATLQDYHRINYYKQYINEVLKAKQLDNVNVKVYTAWSLIDNFEWSHGYIERFGLHYVNFSDPDRPRIPKLSAAWYRETIQRRGFPLEPTHPTQWRYNEEFFYGHFPDDFIWAVATAAYQVEGAWNEDGKSESIWDVTSHSGVVDNGDTGDVACDSYHKYMDDIQLLKNLKVTHYRFSIAWTRVLPDGPDVNPAGVAYYNALINALLDAEIVPMVTMNHWDLPQKLQDKGGWTNRDIVDVFENYARVLYENFGDRVKLWITHNEPHVICHHGYETGELAPGRHGEGYACAHNVLLAHAKAYHLYNNTFKNEQKGQVGITYDHRFGEPYSDDSVADTEAAERHNQFRLGWFANPIFGNGDYPDVMKWQISNKSLEQNYTKSRLPEFTDQEKLLVKGSSDFFGYNFYREKLIQASVSPLTPVHYDSDIDVVLRQDPSWKRSTVSEDFSIVPHSIRRGLNWIKSHYGDVPIYITENGMPDRPGTLNDTDRIQYYKAFINEILKAISLDGVDVRGYTAWSLMDNFEWMRGYSQSFGLHYVNFSDPSRPRIPKASAAYYTSIIEDNGFLKPDVLQPTDTRPSTGGSTQKPVHVDLSGGRKKGTSNQAPIISFSYIYILFSISLTYMHIYIR
ncbi:hypothetical protein ACF0H5_016678 [Mactra antiquata]